MNIQLKEISTGPDNGIQKEDILKKTDKLVKKIGHLQHLLYADKKKSLLVV